MPQNKVKPKLKIDVIITYIVLILVASFASIVSRYVIKQANFNKGQSPTPTPVVEKPSQYPDYDAIKGENPDRQIKIIKITADCPKDGCVNRNAATVEFDGIKKTYVVKGNISRGYLYIEAAVDYERPLTTYDNFYFTLNYSGGHLLTSENLLPVPPSEISRYLYDLRFISYSYKERSFSGTNFLAFFQNGTNLNIHTSISSDRPGRLLKEVSIYYQCADGFECSIEEK